MSQQNKSQSIPVTLAADQEPIDVGKGAAGAPAGGVVSVQGVASSGMFRLSDAAIAGGDGGTFTNMLPDLTNAKWPLGVAVFRFNGSVNVATRVPSIFKTASVNTIGNSAVWTPAAGKKFRLLRFQIELTENATLAVAGILTISFQDAAVAMPIAHDIYLPAAAVLTPGVAYNSGWIDIGDYGILSAAANNALNANLSAALATGNARFNVCGTEE